MDQMNVENRELIPTPDKPIRETPEAISYMGVRLDKASVPSAFVPRTEQHGDYINDRFSLSLQREIATAFHQGQPMLIEGGTSIGKTTTVRKMAAELGWEVHYVNLKGSSDADEFMGKYIPNPNKKGPDDPEYIFADGRVTSGLRQEEGKTKVIILDELNAASPNVLIRLHEVLDALDKNDHVVLTEDASEAVPVDKTKTKIIALMNPPGKGYFGREPLDPAQLRRWVYLKAPTDLPDDTFSYATKSLFGLAPQMEEPPVESFLVSRDQTLLPEQLQEIPGMAEIVARYEEFHRTAKSLVKERRIGADQPQQFTFDDRVEPKRVHDFVLSFYNGDISETMQKALRYYYANKVEGEVDEAKLEELIAHVEYRDVQEPSARRPLGEEPIPVGPTPMPESSPAPTPRPTTPESPMSPLAPSRSEKEAWTNNLGTTLEVPPLSSIVSPEIRKNLERLGFSYRYIPRLDLPVEEMKKRIGAKSVDDFLKMVQAKYPKWVPYESLSDRDKADPKIARNLEKAFWQAVKEGQVDIPKLPGQWIAVETMPKPTYGEKYKPPVDMTRVLGIDDRFNVSWDDAQAAIKDKKEALLTAMGLAGTGVDIRMLEAVEWNLLANREGWGETNTYEWTNTEWRGSGGSYRAVVGSSDDGGAARADWLWPEGPYGNVGFRLAVVLG